MKIINNAGHLIFLGLLILSGCFFIERMLYADTAYYLFQMVNNEKLFIEHHRYSMILLQLLPVMAMKLHLTLKTVILVYSCSIIIVYYSIFCIAVFWLRNYSAGLIMAFILILGVRENFYLPITETHICLVISTLLFAWVSFSDRFAKKNIINLTRYLIAAVIICAGLLSHPVAIFAILFLVVYSITDKQEYKDSKGYILTGMVIILYLLKNFLLRFDSYEEGIISQVHQIKSMLPDLFNLYSAIWFFNHFTSLYLLPSIMLLIVIIYLTINKECLKTLVITFFIVSYLLISFIAFRQGDSDIMMEKNFMPVNYFVLVPFVNDVIIKSNLRSILKTGALLFLIVLCFTGIVRAGSKYRNRISYIEKILDISAKYEGKKFIITRENIDINDIMIPWAFSVETLIFSSVDSPDSARTIYVAKKNELAGTDIKDKKLFLLVNFWLTYRSDHLNPHYFRIPPGEYRYIEAKNIMNKE